MLGFRMVIWSSISLLDIVDNGKEVGEFLFLENIGGNFEQRKIVIFFFNYELLLLLKDVHPDNRRQESVFKGSELILSYIKEALLK